ncbi:neural cell adhesion molecule L1-like protein isoform X1 [Epinephelus moara]|uniref:neural cell adhesion molecule L1-like protein isoform X1 n=1 Tax=Epinephelus moara TaxID=300413 RepID=UPI00214E035F|nr:neural cell adhesion molecule L1-like protein isoform X1 [Epinephelus moara]XP_049893716.1 neural cell adhesion molecule L1-like protein isoform X1 [Epinephelus moara]XP_049893717.1 neural cell adhesion molecule L1-like protein isoform X1 [Epinephelus moara]
MRLQRSPGLVTVLGLIACVCAFHTTAAINIPLEILGHVNIEQLPDITAQSPSSLIAFPFDESFPMTCEAKGNPEPEFRWTKNGQEFDPSLDPRLMKEENSGTFVIPNNGNLTEYQGTYRCYASNKLGTAISKEIEFIVPHVPKFPKETLDPVVVEEGQPFVLECNPPKGIPPLQIYWMTINLQHIEQDERVSMGLNGDLYFSHAVEKDSRRDYCCFAAFPRIRTIVQKTAMSVVVKTKKSDTNPDTANAILERRPSLLTPSGGASATQLVKGEDLKLECIAEGFPTPQVEWVKIGHQLPVKAKLENHGKLLIVPKVELEDSGKYMCKAKNVLGQVVHYFTVTVEEPPEWVVEPESQLSMIGSDVLIKCSATGTPRPTITWRVNGEPLQGAPAANRKVFDDTIVLRNAKESDSAVYQCEASNKHGTLLSNANIMIMNLPPMILTKDGEDYSAVEGKGVMMHCNVFSSPPSTITWSKDDSSESVEGPRFAVHDNGSLEIYSLEKDDTGQYTCLVKNTEGTSAIDAMLYVKDPTRIVVAQEDLQILIGTTAQLSCLAEYDKSFSNDFELLWEKDDMEISLNYTENSRYFVEDGILQIINVSHSDQGVYTCVARTPVDQDSASALLMVLDVPDAPEYLVLSEHKSKSVKLKWIPGDNHNSSTTEFIIEYEESQWEPGNWKELLRVPGNHNSAVLKLHGHVDYSFRVSGVNAVGRGPPSEPTERYKTQPSAPDKNPENIKIEGHLPHEMNINWEPLLPIEHNGPGLEYKVSYRRQDVEEEWKEYMVKRHSFVLKNTPTFVPYEIKIQARNHQGWGPEPKIVSGYSGEDFPSAAPEDVAVEVMNSSVVKVSWTRVHKDKLHGHLGGYRVSWWRLRSLVDAKKSHGDKHTLTFPGDRNHATVPGLTPFSEYSLIVMTFNGQGNGPGSHPLNFKTPEGVPEKNPVFRVKDVQRHTVSLVWAPPLEPNGILTGYLLEYQLINDTEEVGPLQTVDISNPDTTKWILRDLEPLSKYKFYLRSCTTVGCGPIVSEECTTTLETTSTLAPTVGLSKSASPSPPSTPKSPVTKPTRSTIGLASVHGGISTQGWFIGLMCAIALLTLTVLIACFVNRNKGGKYSVKEKEDLHPDVESQGMNDDTFCEYSDNDEKPLKGSQHSLSREIKAGDSGDSLVDYGDEDAQFNEDGSFIGEYAGRKEKRASAEIKATIQTPA